MTYEITDENRPILFAKLLESLKVLDEVCRSNGLQYFASGGTALGAVRHKGFIPWDDDVDIVLYRKDYNRLKELAAAGAFPEPFFFQTPATDSGYSKGFSRLRNSETTLIPFMDYSMKCNHGVFIDIFPLDAVPDSEFLLKTQCASLRIYRGVMNAYSRYISGLDGEAASLAKKVGYAALKQVFRSPKFSIKSVYDKFEQIAAKYENTKHEKVGVISAFFASKRLIWDKDCWENPVYIPFENTEIPVPENVDKMLTHQYGDYMTPVKAPTMHGEMVFSADIPYEQFLRENDEPLKQRWLKWYTGKQNIQD